MLALSATMLGVALAYDASHIGIGMLVAGVVSYGVVYSPWYSTPDHDAPTTGLMFFGTALWLFVILSALYATLISYDLFMVFGFVVLALPVYRSLRSAMRAPAALIPI